MLNPEHGSFHEARRRMISRLRSTYRKNKTQENSHLYIRGQERFHKEGNPKTEQQTADGYFPGSQWSITRVKSRWRKRDF